MTVIKLLLLLLIESNKSYVVLKDINRNLPKCLHCCRHSDLDFFKDNGHLLLTFRGTVRRGHNYNTVQKQILEKLLENHGVSDISDLRYGIKSTLGKA